MIEFPEVICLIFHKIKKYTFFAYFKDFCVLYDLLKWQLNSYSLQYYKVYFGKKIILYIVWNAKNLTSIEMT